MRLLRKIKMLERGQRVEKWMKKGGLRLSDDPTSGKEQKKTLRSVCCTHCAYFKILSIYLSVQMSLSRSDRRVRRMHRLSLIFALQSKRGGGGEAQINKAELWILLPVCKLTRILYPTRQQVALQF
jgi:5-methylcytosine-specific restriction endonuclease McrA